MPFNKLLFAYLFFGCFAYTANAQMHADENSVLLEAREIIGRLSAPDMFGRGYGKQGDKVAANYIADQFSQIGLQSLVGRNNTKQYYQNFNVDAIVFTGGMELLLNGNTYLEAGRDFLIDPSSAGIQGTYEVIRIGQKQLLNNKKFNKLLQTKHDDKVLHIRYKPKNLAILKGRLGRLYGTTGAAGYITTPLTKSDKLTWHSSGQPKYFTEVLTYCPNTPRRIKEATFNIDSEYLQNYATQNVLGMVKGTQHPDKFFVITAHYDHLGMLGSEQYIPGANDNASGIAMLLSLAKYYTANPPAYSVAFMAFSGEELGLLGSKHYVEHPEFPLTDIQFLINLDIVGTGSEGITVVNGTAYTPAFNLMGSINKRQNLLPSIKARNPAANSDHHPFYERGVPSVFIYTEGGPQHYHDIYDRVETLPLTEFNDLRHLIIAFIEQYRPISMR